jgi:hypothetical protein
MMGGVCDELVLVTRSDREVPAWEYSRGSCLYFLARDVASLWRLKVILLGIQLALRGGRLVSRVLEVLSSVKFGINRPHSGPDHCNRAAQASEQDGGQRRPGACEEYPDLYNGNRNSGEWRPKAEQQKYSRDSRNHMTDAQPKPSDFKEMHDPETEQNDTCQYALKQKTSAWPAVGECGKETLHRSFPLLVSYYLAFGSDRKGRK